MSKLLVIRGATGSGKSSLANYIHNYIVGSSVLLPQDVFTVDFIKNESSLFKASLDALETSARAYLNSDTVVILEGVFSAKHWEEMIYRLSVDTERHYFFLSTTVDTSIERAGKREKSAQITEEDVRLWHPKSTPLHAANETVIAADTLSTRVIAQQIASQCNIELDLSQEKAKLCSNSFLPASNI